MNQFNSIFVYGTLKEEMLKEVMPQIKPYIQFGKNGYIKGRLYSLGEFPGAKPTRLVNKKVQGQLLNIRPGYENDVLNAIDEYEGYNALSKASSLFVRKKVKVFTANDVVVEAWIYWYNRPVQQKDEIRNGIYTPSLNKSTPYVIN